VGGKTRTGADGKAAQGWDHDPPAKRKWTPLGILVLATGALMLIFGSQETSDFWVDGLHVWWQHVQGAWPAIRQLKAIRKEIVGIRPLYRSFSDI
jgi:hypothetical protein